ncbi:hypothetical protein WN943_015879 [Citrus x changshan-huyou]
MASQDIESPWLCAAGESFCGSFNIRVEEGNAADILHVLEVPTSSETKDVWDKLFEEGNRADVYIVTKDESCIQAHSSLLSIASPVLGNILQQSKLKNGFIYIKIPGVPHEAVYAFVRFLYSSCSPCARFLNLFSISIPMGSPNLNTIVSSPVFLILLFVLSFSLPVFSDTNEEAYALLKWKARLQSYILSKVPCAF